MPLALKLELWIKRSRTWSSFTRDLFKISSRYHWWWQEKHLVVTAFFTKKFKVKPQNNQNTEFLTEILIG